MRFYLSDLIPRLAKFSKQLDTNAKLVNQNWILIQDDEASKLVYLYSDDGSLDVYQNGIEIDTGTFKLVNNSLQIKISGTRGLFKIGFFDEYVMALKRDSTNHFAFFVNETRYEGEFNSAQNIFDFLSLKYLNNNNAMSNSNRLKNNKLVEYKTDKGTILIEQKFAYSTPMKTNKVYKGEKPASNGKYKLGFMWYMQVENGKIKDISFF